MTKDKKQAIIGVIILIILILAQAYSSRAQTIPRPAILMVSGEYEIAFEQHKAFLSSDEGQELVKSLYTEAGLWFLLPEVKLGKYTYDAVMATRYFAKASKYSHAVITVMKLDGVAIKLYEGGKNWGFIHILQRHASKFLPSTLGKASTFAENNPNLIIKLMEKFVKTGPKLTKGNNVMIYNGFVDGTKYRMITKVKNGETVISSFFPVTKLLTH